MEREQTLRTIARIEAALARLEAAYNAPATAPDSALPARHEALRQTVSATLLELDTLIGALER
jgi:multidrug efflux pump subunit AcrA (membrane-fusion protein)